MHRCYGQEVLLHKYYLKSYRVSPEVSGCLERITVFMDTPNRRPRDFDSVTGGKSTTVSYLSESPNCQNSKGRRTKSEFTTLMRHVTSMLQRNDSIYRATRMPTGSMERDEFLKFGG